MKKKFERPSAEATEFEAVAYLDMNSGAQAGYGCPLHNSKPIWVTGKWICPDCGRVLEKGHANKVW